jgi:hypothetical protein
MKIVAQSEHDQLTPSGFLVHDHCSADSRSVNLKLQFDIVVVLEFDGEPLGLLLNP